MKHSLEINKQTAIDFLSLAFNDCQPAEAVRRYVGSEYIQHNPLVADGPAPFIAYFEDMASKWPGKRVKFLRSVAENDLVMLHCHQTWPGDHEYVTMDIFRFDKNGKIVEHWDTMQVVPELSENSNTMY